MEKLFSIKDEKHFVQRTQSGWGLILIFEVNIRAIDVL